MTPRIFRSAIAKAEGGSFLLEALIAVLIVALGIMGLIGLQARAVQSSDDSQYRSEAAFLANDLLGRMWASNFSINPACASTVTQPCIADFAHATGLTPYTDFQAWVFARLPGASTVAVQNPDVTIAPRFGDPTMGYEVVITIRWHPPGDPPTYPDRRYQTAATVKLN